MPETPQHDMAAIRRRARERAIRMGHAKPEQEQQAPAPPLLSEQLTRHPRVLRALLMTGRLTAEQAPAARAFLADYDAEQRRLQSAPTPNFPEDAA